MLIFSGKASKIMHCDILPVFKAAQRVIGATAPNPPVAAAAYSLSGALLGVAAHEQYGGPHAEAALLTKARTEGWLDQVNMIYVTLEPCNHHGLTPPCAQALLDANIKRVAYGISDPNPKAAGGAEFLKDHGVNVQRGAGADMAIMSLLPFLHRVKTGRPLVVVKQALRHNGSMIPDAGQKTFTDQAQLTLAHRMRKSCDTIVTGSGTVLADNPAFTVRHVDDHINKTRRLVILDRQNRVSDIYKEEATMRGFDVSTADTLDAALAGQGLMTLVEAGPSILSSIMKDDAWDVWVTLHEDGRTETAFNSSLSVHGTLDPGNADLLWAL